jgi:hypothetical protein
VIEPGRSADDLFAPDPGCEVETADAGVSRRVIYRGTAGTDRWVTVDITRVGGTVGGFIIYDERGELLGLSGSADAKGNTVLTEFVGPGGQQTAGLYDGIPTRRVSPTGRIIGRLTPSTLEGTWRSADGKTRRTIALGAVVTSDSLPAGEGNLVAYPIFEPRTKHARLNAAMRKRAQQALDAHRSSITRPCTGCSFEHTFYLECATDDIVSLMVVTHEGTGGAKAKSSHVCVTLRTGNGDVQPLTLGSLFATRARNRLAELIAAKLRDLGVASPATAAGVRRRLAERKSSLSEVDAFALTPAGLKLVFDTTASGPATAGPAVVLLPYDEVREMVRSDALALLPRR